MNLDLMKSVGRYRQVILYMEWWQTSSTPIKIHLNQCHKCRKVSRTKIKRSLLLYQRVINKRIVYRWICHLTWCTRLRPEGKRC